MKFVNSLKQLTLGAVLSLTFALLIIHPGMFASAHAFPTPPDYQFDDPVNSIAPDLEGEDYGLNPFYAGRPLYDEDMVYLTNWIVGTWNFLMKWGKILGGIFTAGWLLWYLYRAIKESIDFFVEAEYRDDFREFVEYLGGRGVIGATYCENDKKKGDRIYGKCLKGQFREMSQSFRDHARQCEGGRHSGREKGRSSFDWIWSGKTTWYCHQHHPDQGYIKLEPEWDGSAWL
ncbi:MAG: hypothetical protein F4X56_04245 [Gammaproteobacteria bacterium]|nr:hypothetical protein [Gammaproteobacteria bacterium]